ncbi:hypothetical protein P3T16_003456 [Paraburkholderia sp. GAS42]
MKVATIGTALLLTLAVTQPVWAEDSLASQAQSVIEAVHPVHMKAQIIGIEPASRTLTLKGSAAMWSSSW